jgi:hypothetical protein
MQKPPPTCFFATAIFSPPIKVLGGFIKCLPLLYWRSIQICNSGFHLVFFFLGCPVCYYTESKWWWCRTHLLLFLLHQRFTYWHKKQFGFIWFSPLPWFLTVCNALRVFLRVFFFCTCVRRRKNGTRSITKVHTGVWEGWSFSHLTTFGHHTHKEPPPFFTFDNLHSKVIL